MCKVENKTVMLRTRRLGKYVTDKKHLMMVMFGITEGKKKKFFHNIRKLKEKEEWK